MKNKKLIPEIRFPEFSGKWIEKRLGEIGKITTGKTPSTKQQEYWNGNILFVTPLDIQNNKYIENAHRNISKKGLKQSKTAPKGSVLFVCIGSTIGKVAITLRDVGFNQQINAIFPKNANNEYLYYALLKKNRQIAKLAGEQAVPIINKSDFSKIKIHIPPTPDEQNKISDFLSNIDEKIEIISKKIEELKKYKKGMLQKLLDVKCNNGKCEPELRFKGFSGNWIEKRLGEILIKISTGLNPRNNFKLNEKEDYYYVTIKNFTNNRLCLNNCDKIDKKAFELINKRADLQKNDILFASIGRIGDCYLIKETPTNWNINESVFSLRPNIKLIAPELLCFIFINRKMKKVLESKVTGSTFKSIKINDLKKIKLHLPPTLAEQQKIADFLSSIDEKIELNENKLEKLKAYKQGLLQKMFV